MMTKHLFFIIIGVIMTAQKYAQVKVSKLRDALVENGMSEEDAALIKGKGNLIEAVEQAGIDIFGEQEEVSVDDLQLDVELEDEKFDDSLSEVKENNTDLPKYASNAWSDYVMSQFEEEELFEERPTVPALRRVTELLLGEIVESRPHDICVMGDTVVCNYTLVVSWGRGLLENNGGYFDVNIDIPTRMFGAIGEASVKNTQGVFQNYQASIAETRAEGRALKKALGIKCSTAEEIMLDDKTSVLGQVTEEEWKGEENISNTQKKFIELKCRELGIDVDKFINKKFYLGEADERQFEKIDDVNREVASYMIQEINKYQSNTEQSSSIPEQIKVRDNDES